MKVNNVSVEYLNNPIGIDVVSPRIRWILEGVKKQKSFEIAYSVNESDCIVIKKETDEMFYDFEETFKSKDIVTFKIKITDSFNNESEYSEPNSFEMGLLNKSDWTGKWISGNYKTKKQRYPVDYFLKEFNVSSIKKARLYITACGIYEAHINNQRVGSFVLAPGFTDYRKRIQYQTYDVTNLLKEGKNTFGVMLADGWYRGSIGARGRICTYGKQTKFVAQLEILGKNGEKYIINSDNSFKWSNDGPITFADLKDGEIVNNNVVQSYSGNAIEVKFDANLTASNNTFIEEHERFKPLKVTKSKTGKTVLEFKQNLAGYLSFKVNAHKGDKIRIVMGEMLDENGDVSLKNIQLPNGKRITPEQKIEVICKEGENVYYPHFYISGFKYAGIEFNGDINKDDFEQIALYSSFEETSNFECSNELINIFYKNTIWSLKSNSADIPTDCPTRERMGWTGDSQVFFNTASFVTNYAAFTKKHLVDVFDRQWKNGKLPQIAPFSNEDWFMAPMNGSVGWADVGVLTPYRFYYRYGDKRILLNNYDNMMRYAKFMISRCGRIKGIYAIYAKNLHLSKENKKYQVNNGQSYGEWAEPSDVRAFVWTDFCEPHPEESMAYTVFVMEKMIEISKICHKEENIPLLEEYRDGVRKAYQELVTKPRFSLDTNRQAKLVRPLYMHLLNEEQEEYAKKRLIEALDWYDWKLGTGFLSTPFILDVLQDMNPEYAYRLLENEKMPGWLYMAKNNTGTIWEGWEGPSAQQGISSLNHYSKGAMVEWLFSNMLGIKVVGNNFFEIRPVVGGHVSFAKGTYKSIYGTISSSWERKQNKTILKVEIPSNTKAHFVFGTIDKELETGSYTFEC